MRLNFCGAASALLLVLSMSACGGSNPAAPVQTVHCADGSVAPNNDASKCVAAKPETVSFSSISPANGSVIAQSASVYPMANVQFSATTNIPATVTYTLDGNSVSVQANVPVGTHNLRIVATPLIGVGSDTTITFTVPQAGVNIHLIVATAIGGRVPQGARAVIEDADSASFDAQGNVFVPSRFAITESNAKIVIRGDAGMIPFLGRVPSRFFNNLTVIGVPTTFSIASGVYAGQMIPIHMDSAYTLVTSLAQNHLSFYLRTQQADGSWAYNVGSWPGTAKYAFFKYAVSAQDSIDTKKTTDSLNVMYGYTVFTPTDTADVKANGGLVVYLNHSNSVSGGSVPGLQGDYNSGEVDLQLASWPAGTAGNLAGVPVYYLLWNEFLHTIGVGHTCSWVSLAQSSCSYDESPVITSRDVGYILLMIRVRALERQYNTRFSMAQAHQGERMSQGLSEDKVAYVDANGNIVP